MMSPEHDHTLCKGFIEVARGHTVGSLERLEGGEYVCKNSTQTDVKFTYGTAALGQCTATPNSGTAAPAGKT
jgi:hypothetical protein